MHKAIAWPNVKLRRYAGGDLQKRGRGTNRTNRFKALRLSPRERLHQAARINEDDIKRQPGVLHRHPRGRRFIPKAMPLCPINPGSRPRCFVQGKNTRQPPCLNSAQRIKSGDRALSCGVLAGTAGNLSIINEIVDSIAEAVREREVEVSMVLDTGSRPDGSSNYDVLQSLWPTDLPFVAARIEDWERTIRKREGLVGLGSQSATGIVECPIGNVIIEQSPTQIFMPNHKADKAALIDEFGLTTEEFRWVRELGDTSRCFLVKHGTHSVIARLDLSGEDDLLAVLSGREETVGLLDQIRAEVGDDPKDWMPIFQQRRTQSTCGDEEHNLLIRSAPECGYCKVICFSPCHDLTVANMRLGDVVDVIGIWVEETARSRADSTIAYVQIFENRGAVMGCSNPHPHCQVWASSSIPSIVSRENDAQKQYISEHESPMLVDYLRLELDREIRIVYENEHFVVLVPYWAVWPFETLVVPKRHHPTLQSLSKDEQIGLADSYQMLVRTYNEIFECEFPYTMGIHQAPLDSEIALNLEWQLHLHFYPPLLRSSTVKKFMVGYELLASPQRDITAEVAAKTLRDAAHKARQNFDRNVREGEQ